jgi:hypothetical protein
VSKATARSIDKPVRSENQSELDETASLPLLPDVSDVSGKAANDTAFRSPDNATNESLERLVKLAESIDKRLEHIAEALATTQSRSPQATKKKARSKK